MPSPADISQNMEDAIRVDLEGSFYRLGRVSLFLWAVVRVSPCSELGYPSIRRTVVAGPFWRRRTALAVLRLMGS